MAAAAFGLCAALLAMSAIDIDTHLLPDSMTLPLLWTGLIVNFNGMFANLHDAVLGAIFGYLGLWAVHWLFPLGRGVEGMGFGGFKLLAALRAWLRWAAVPPVGGVSGGCGGPGGAAVRGGGRT